MKLKNIFLLFLALSLTGLSCKKKSDGDGPIHPDYFEFGYGGGFSLNKIYRIEGGIVFAQDSLKIPLGTIKYATAQQLLKDFPSYLLQHPNQNFGCLGCVDELVTEIHYGFGGTEYSWKIDSDETGIPTELRAYMKEVIQVTDQMY